MSERSISLRNVDEERLLFGHLDRNLRLLRGLYSVDVVARGGQLKLTGSPDAIDLAHGAIERILRRYRETGADLSQEELEHLLKGDRRPATNDESASAETTQGRPSPMSVRGRSENQERYLSAMRSNVVTFGIGPAGTGKTYLAVASAVAFLRSGEFRKIILVRPAVEAGESLGFLPGDIAQKINPYLRPLYDALNDFLPRGQLKRYMEEEIIEILPLAYMRGRTLDHAVMILDEGQNTTTSQMKMFLTRLGARSKAIVTGDVTQIDLPVPRRSGLVHAQRILKGIPGVTFIYFTKGDIVRHPVVQDIVRAYAEDEDVSAGRNPDTEAQAPQAADQGASDSSAAPRAHDAGHDVPPHRPDRRFDRKDRVSLRKHGR